MKAHKFLTGNYMFRKKFGGLVLYVEVERVAKYGIGNWTKHYVKANEADLAWLRNNNHL